MINNELYIITYIDRLTVKNWLMQIWRLSPTMYRQQAGDPAKPVVWFQSKSKGITIRRSSGVNLSSGTQSNVPAWADRQQTQPPILYFFFCSDPQWIGWYPFTFGRTIYWASKQRHRSLVCCMPWDRKESGTTEWLTLTKLRQLHSSDFLTPSSY